MGPVLSRAISRAISCTIQALLGIAVLNGCSNLKPSDAKDSAGVKDSLNASNASSTSELISKMTPTATTTAVATATRTSQAIIKTGMPAFCQGIQRTDALYCITCTPREIPLVTCATTGPNFDPDTQCVTNIDSIRCQVMRKTLTIDFAAKTPIELLYDRMPLLMAAAQLITRGMLATAPRLQSMVTDILEVVSKERHALFTSDDITPVIAEIQTVIKHAYPQVPTKELQDTQMVANALFQKTRRQLLEGNGFLITDMLSFLNQLLATIPPSIFTVGQSNPLITATAMNNLINCGANVDPGLKYMIDALGICPRQTATATTTINTTETATDTATSTATSTATASSMATATATATSTATATALHIDLDAEAN